MNGSENEHLHFYVCFRLSRSNNELRLTCWKELDNTKILVQKGKIREFLGKNMVMHGYSETFIYLWLITRNLYPTSFIQLSKVSRKIFRFTLNRSFLITHFNLSLVLAKLSLVYIEITWYPIQFADKCVYSNLFIDQ